MAEGLQSRAYAAFLDDDFEQAVELFTEAISHDSENPELFANRAQAHIKLQNYTDAVADASRAIELNASLSKAYLRKGIACFSLEEYQTAKAAFSAGAALEPKNPSFNSWIQKCDAALAEEDAANEDDLLLKSHTGIDGATASPHLSTERSLLVAETSKSQSVTPQAVGIASTSEATDLVAPLVVAPSQPKFRHDFYEKPNEVVVTIFAKGIKEKDVKIDFGEQFLSVGINTNTEDPYVLQVRLFAKIVVPQCAYKILNTKIEIHLAKLESIKWKCLEYDGKDVVLQRHNVSSDVSGIKVGYPSSSKKAHKDWDKLASEVKKEEKDEKLEGDAALNKLFRDIYQNADEDTRRAMSKSFVESNGTVLSTNWKEVGEKHVEGSPPQGMEMKKWEV